MLRRGSPSARGEAPPELRPFAPRRGRARPGVDVLFPASSRQVAPLLRAVAPGSRALLGVSVEAAAGCARGPAARLRQPASRAAPAPPRARSRSPGRCARATRSFGVTWHRMDAELDTGAMLAQTTVPIDDDDVTIEQIGPKLGAAALGLLPRVLERVAAGDPGDVQPEEGASWASHFGEDYAEIDWSRSAREIHNQVRAWALTFGLAPVPRAGHDARRRARPRPADESRSSSRTRCASRPATGRSGCSRTSRPEPAAAAATSGDRRCGRGPGRTERARSARGRRGAS